MRTILTILFYLVCQSLFATNYYVANVGSDANSGEIGNPFATISKAISVAVSGDTIKLNKGDSWNEKINPISGIIFSSYGTGNKPIVTGFQNLSGWTSSGNIWSATFLNSVKYQNTVYINGAIRAKGRYPNTGYLTFTSHSGTNQITTGLTGTPNYTGGQVAIRNVHWVINNPYITSQSGGVINFSPNSYYPLNDNYGFIINNITSVLDTLNEWSCDTTSFVVNVYATSQPTVKASSIDTLVNCISKSNITFDGIQFGGANLSAFQVDSSSNITIKNCTIRDCGANAITGRATNYLTISNDSIMNCWNDALVLLDFNLAGGWSNSNHLTFSNNYVYNIGTSEVMGKGGNQAHTAITYFGNSADISWNTFKNVGYNGIVFQGDSNNVSYNFHDSFCYVKDDGAAIYTNGVNGKYFKGNKVLHNIISNGKGAPSGTSDGSSQVYGLYQDDYSHNVEMSYNTVSKCASSGIQIHNADSSIVIGNIFAFNGSIAGTSQIKYVLLSGSPHSNLYVTGNLCYSDSLSYVVDMAALGTTMASLGTMDSNYYSKPLNDSQIVKYGSNYWSLHQWQDSGKDIHSYITPTGITGAKAILLYNTSVYPSTFALGGTYVDLRGVSYTNAIEIQPYQSAVLFKAVSDIPQQNSELKTILYKVVQ